MAQNILSLCVLGSNSAVRTTLKSRFLQNPKDRHELPGSTCPRAYTHLDAGPVQKFTQIFACGASKGLDADGRAFIPTFKRTARAAARCDAVIPQEEGNKVVVHDGHFLLNFGQKPDI